MADFANPVVIGGTYDVLAAAIYYRTAWRERFGHAAALSLILVAACLVACLLYASGRFATGPPAPAPGAPRPMARRARWGLAGVAWAFAGALAVVYGAIALGSVVTAWGSDWSPSTVHWIDVGLRGRALGNSLRLGVLAGLLGALLALLTAWVLERVQPPGARLLVVTVALTAALPGTVVGLGYALAFGWPPWLLGGIWLPTLSVAFWRFPLATLAAYAAFRRVSPGAEETAESLGAGPVAAFLTATAPTLAGTALVIVGFFAIEGLATVSSVVFFSGSFPVGSVEVLGAVDERRLGAACALTTILVAAVGLLVLLVRGAARRDRAALLRSVTLNPGFGVRGRS
jgi:iron(III) transport system permease protein